jgi:hypothetical protein
VKPQESHEVFSRDLFAKSRSRLETYQSKFFEFSQGSPVRAFFTVRDDQTQSLSDWKYW